MLCVEKLSVRDIDQKALLILRPNLRYNSYQKVKVRKAILGKNFVYR